MKNNFLKKAKPFIILHIMLLVYSFCGVFIKLASKSEFLSLKFFLFYGISIFILGIYTLGWQQLLKKIPLVTAFLNKSVTIIWSMIWGILFFSESPTLSMIIGSIIVLIGVSLVVLDNE